MHYRQEQDLHSRRSQELPKLPDIMQLTSDNTSATDGRAPGLRLSASHAVLLQSNNKDSDVLFSMKAKRVTVANVLPVWALERDAWSSSTRHPCCSRPDCSPSTSASYCINSASRPSRSCRLYSKSCRSCRNLLLTVLSCSSLSANCNGTTKMYWGGVLDLFWQQRIAFNIGRDLSVKKAASLA